MVKPSKKRVHVEVKTGKDGISQESLDESENAASKRTNEDEETTDRWNAEEQMKDLAKFPSENPDPVIRIARNGTILFCNPASLHLLNDWKCGVEELAPENWRTRVTDALTSSVKQEMDEKYGQRTFSFSIVPVPTADYVNIYGRDITSRKEVEEALRTSQRDLNHAQAVAQIGSWRLDIRRNLLLWSDETHRMFGIPKGTIMTYETFLSAVHPDDREYVDQKWQAALCGEPYDIEHRIVAKGKVKWVREKAELEFDKEGTLMAGFGTTQDITDRKQLEERLFQSEKKYRTLYETSLDGIVSVDLSGYIIECNEAYANMVGYTKDELKTFTYQHLTPERWHQMEDTIVKEQVFTRGFSDVYETEHIRKDGSVFPIAIRVWLMKDDSGKPFGLWGIVTDITERKWMERELRRHTRNLEQLVEERTRQLKDAERMAAIGETASMVGHDIRNPLQSIEGAVYLAKEEMKSIHSKTDSMNTVEEMLDTIHEQAAYIDKIVSDLQDYARPIEPQLEAINIQTLLDDILAEVNKPQNIEVSISVKQDSCAISVDPTITKRILINLITNAIQAMPTGGKLTIEASKKQEGLLLTVQDTGTGIAEENKTSIFQPLFTTKAKGTGFGLAVVKRLVEAHHGTITFETQVGVGTTFAITLPVSKEGT